MSFHGVLGGRSVLAGIFIVCFSVILHAQTTAFTYQGKLTDTAAAANGSYDMRFALFDQLAGGLPQPQPGPITVTRTGVTVTNGIFTVQLDFGVAALTGDDRFLDISVKKSADPTYTPLVPRQQLTSSPYAVQTLNASLLGGVDASQYVQTNDARLADARPASSVNFTTATLTGVVPIANGGTGSNTQNFVDLSTSTQSITSPKTFTNAGNVFNGTFTGNGTGLTLGQSAVSVFGTTSLTVTSANLNVLFTVPGLTQTVTVPSGVITQIHSTGGVQTTSLLATGYSAVFVAIIVDGNLLPDGAFSELVAANTTGLPFGDIQSWSLQTNVALTPGTHTIGVAAGLTDPGSANATVSGTTNSANQGTLSVNFLRQ